MTLDTCEVAGSNILGNNLTSRKNGSSAGRTCPGSSVTSADIPFDCWPRSSDTAETGAAGASGTWALELQIYLSGAVAPVSHWYPS